MKQHEAVILAMQQNGGYATLGQFIKRRQKSLEANGELRLPLQP